MDRTLSCFFALLRAGLWGKPVDEALFENFNDWQEIQRLARAQTVVGLVLEGMATLPQNLRPPRSEYMQWLSMVMQIENANDMLNDGVIKVYSMFRDAGFEGVLLKGQGLAQYYREPRHRQPGDIDLYFGEENYQKTSKFIEEMGFDIELETSYHCSFKYGEMEVENHRVFVDFYNNKNKKKLRVWQERQKDYPKADFKNKGASVPTLPHQTNAIYIFLHLLHHFLQVGIGLRQVCDWAIYLTANQQHIDKKQFATDLEDLPIKRVATAFAHVCVNYLGMNPEVFPFPIDTIQAKKDGEWLLHDIIAAGNFGEDILHHFRSNTIKGSVRAYSKAVRRFVSIYRLCPSEVRSYPVKWLMSKIKKDVYYED